MRGATDRRVSLTTKAMVWPLALGLLVACVRASCLEPVSLRSSALIVRVDPDAGTIEVTDRRCGRVWKQPEPAGRDDRKPFRDVDRDDGGISIVMASWGRDCRVRLSIGPEPADLQVAMDMQDRSGPFTGALAPDAFLPATRDAYMAVADYTDGHLYPLTLDPFPRTWLSADRLDMPWFGIGDTLTGAGYLAIIETSDDAYITTRPASGAGFPLSLPRIGWHPSRGTFAYPRRVLYRFLAGGGYVAMARSYRAYAATHGLIRPLREKARANPRVRQLYGAVDVWGNATIDLARQTRAAGIDRMLLHGAPGPEEMRRINELGYLTSEYDNYTDILPVEAGKRPDQNHDTLPGAAVLNPDGERMKAWLTYDKKVQYMKRCPSLWEIRAREVIAERLRTLPFGGRFIDVTTAEGLYECWDPDHPLTRADKRRCGERLLAAVASLGLVVGGEHGIWWGAPYLSYVEGMMSSYQFAWPAGHLIRPRNRSDSFDGPYDVDTWENYERWGIGHRYRAPLWQLTFHDCVVSTWYWGDSNDFLIEAAPEMTAKKEAFNVLYGTMPMLWANREGAWAVDRELFLRTATVASAVHREVAEAAMVDHAFVGGDRDLQRTRFADGTTCITNFGTKARRVTLGGKLFTLPQNGYAVAGPRISLARVLRDGEPVTTLRTERLWFQSDGTRTISLWREGPGNVRVRLAGAGRMELPEAEVARLAGAGRRVVYILDSAGNPLRSVPPDTSIGQGRLRAGLYGIMAGPALARADVSVVAGRSRLLKPSVRQGEPLTARVTLRNLGDAAAPRADVLAYAETEKADRLLARTRVDLPPNDVRTISLTVPTDRLDGVRRIRLVVRTRRADLCPGDNRLDLTAAIAADSRRWRHAAVVEIRAGEQDRTGLPIILPVAAPSMDPASVRVVAMDGPKKGPVPAQVDELAEGRYLSFAPIGPFPRGSVRRFRIVWNDRGGADRLMAPSGGWYDSQTGAVRAETYEARLADGVVRDIAVRQAGRAAIPVILRLMVSSEETGWTDEPGTVRSTRILADGPVRTVVEVRKELRSGVRFTKRFTFAATHIEVQTEWQPAVGVPSRAFYATGGAYEDSRDRRATIDGRGDAEGVTDGSGPPRWYTVRSQSWAHTCIAMTTFYGLAYWDAADMGGIGFVAPQEQPCTIAYRFHGAGASPSVGQEDYQSLISPPEVIWVDGSLAAALRSASPTVR